MKNILVTDTDRRTFSGLLLKAGAVLLLPQLLGPLSAAAKEGIAPQTPGNSFHFAQMTYGGGNWDPHPRAHLELLREIELRTSIRTVKQRVVVGDLNERFFSYPFLYITGRDEFDPFTEREVEVLRRFLSYGGFLLADDCIGHPGYDFDKSFRREIKRVFPHKELQRLSWDHSVFRSYYLVNFIGGKRLVSPYLEGIHVEDRTPVIYCQNDLGCAWEKDTLGNWVHQVKPGGRVQRSEAFYLGVNIVMYALTLNYKRDQIHIPFLKKKLG